MKVIKTWNLSGEDEFEEKHSLYINDHADNMLFFIGELNSFLRQKWKYPPDEMSSETFAMIEEIRERFFEMAEEHGLNLDKLGA